MKISEIKDERALDTLADIMEPAARILADEKIKTDFKGQPMLKLAAYIIKNHKTDVIEVLARLDGTEPDKYSFTLASLMRDFVELLNDPGLIDLFTSPGQKKE